MFDRLKSLFNATPHHAMFRAVLKGGRSISVRLKVPKDFGLQEALFKVCAEVETKYGPYESVEFLGLDGVTA